MNNINSPEQFFSKHAGDYTKSESHAHGRDLARLIEVLEPKPSEVALDVATGTGFTALEVSKKVSQVFATDITSEMLEEAKKLALKEGANNIRFEKAEAASLPYNDCSFDIVTTRRAAHHFNDISQFLNEISRVLKPCGRLGLVDMSPIEGTQDFCNLIERLRDHTHAKALTAAEWKIAMNQAHLSLTHIETQGEEISFEKWLYPVKMGGREEEEIRKEWRKSSKEIQQALTLKDGPLNVKSWIKTRIILIAHKTTQ